MSETTIARVSMVLSRLGQVMCLCPATLLVSAVVASGYVYTGGRGHSTAGAARTRDGGAQLGPGQRERNGRALHSSPGEVQVLFRRCSELSSRGGGKGGGGVVCSSFR